MTAHEKRCLRDHGYYVHVVNDPNMPMGLNAHTHGIAHHPDLQIVFAQAIINPQLLMNIFQSVVDLIHKGQTFKDGDTSDDVMHDLTVKFVDAKDGDRDVLRLILPDKQNRFERDTMDHPYVHQYDDLPKTVQAIIVNRLKR